MSSCRVANKAQGRNKEITAEDEFRIFGIFVKNISVKAMILAAGLGSRMHPLTLEKPKAMVVCNGKPLIHWAIEKLQSSGCREIVINVHHFPDQIIDYVLSMQGMKAVIHFSDERFQLLDSGGGVLHAAPYLQGDDAILIWNVDVISGIHIENMLEQFYLTKPLALLAVRNRKSSRYLLFDKKNQLCGWRNLDSQQEVKVRESHVLNALAFSGIQIISPDFFQNKPAKTRVSLTELYLDLCDHHTILSYPHDEDYWFDVGTPEKLRIAENHLSSHF